MLLCLKIEILYHQLTVAPHCTTCSPPPPAAHTHTQRKVLFFVGPLLWTPSELCPHLCSSSLPRLPSCWFQKKEKVQKLHSIVPIPNLPFQLYFLFVHLKVLAQQKYFLLRHTSCTFNSLFIHSSFNLVNNYPIIYISWQLVAQII